MLLFHVISFSFAQQRIIVIDDSQQKSLQNISVLIDGSSPIEFLDDGISPDKLAQDSVHTAVANIVKDTAKMQFNSKGEKLNEINLTVDQLKQLDFIVKNNLVTISDNSSMRLFEYEVGKTPDEIELQAKQSPDSITANIAIVNQGTPLTSITVSLNGNSYALKDDGKDGDEVRGDNTWSVQIQTQKQEKLQLQFDDGDKWQDSISINCSDKDVQNIQIIRMTDNFLLFGNEENPNQNNPQPPDSKAISSSNPTNGSFSTDQDQTFGEIPDSNEGDIYLLLIFIGGLILTFFIQIYLRWKRDIQPTIEEVQKYLQLNANKGVQDNEKQEHVHNKSKVTSTDSVPYGNDQINKEQSDKGSVDDAE